MGDGIMSKQTLDKIHIAGVIILVITSLLLAASSWFGLNLPTFVFWAIVAVDVVTVLVMEIVAVKRAKYEGKEEY